MPFLPPNQRRQSTEGDYCKRVRGKCGVLNLSVVRVQVYCQEVELRAADTSIFAAHRPRLITLDNLRCLQHYYGAVRLLYNAKIVFSTTHPPTLCDTI